MNRERFISMSLAGAALGAVLFLLSQPAAAQALPRIKLGCLLPKTTEASEFCTGTGATSTNLECRSQGQWDYGQTYSARCEASANRQFTFDASSHTAIGPYVVLTLQTSVPTIAAATRYPIPNQARASAGYSLRVNAPPMFMYVPLKMRVQGSLRGESSNGAALVYASVDLGSDHIANGNFSACGGPKCFAAPASTTIDTTLYFAVPPNKERTLSFNLQAIINGPLGGTDPNGGGLATGFMDPLPELDTGADPKVYGLPVDWFKQVTLEISEGARPGDAPDGGAGEAPGGKDPPEDGAGGGGCSVPGRGLPEGAGPPGLLCALWVAWFIALRRGR